MGIALFSVFAFVYTASNEGGKINPDAMMGKVVSYVLSGYISTLVKDRKS